MIWAIYGGQKAQKAIEGANVTCRNMHTWTILSLHNRIELKFFRVSSYFFSKTILWSWKLGQKENPKKFFLNWCQDLWNINSRLPARFIDDKTVETVEIVKVWTFSSRLLWNIKGMNFGRISSKIPKNIPKLSTFCPNFGIFGNRDIKGTG